ncbi:MAG: response regulator, partial [Rhodopila sp.]|nr:response regulator [Rhodopila sp.]
MANAGVPSMTIDRNEAALAARHCRPYVLVVDDEPVLREEIVEYLQARGFEADAVSNGRDALDRLRADSSVTVMLSDIRMPEMDGLALAEAAIAQSGEEHAIEVVMLTGHATVNDAAAAARLRAIDFLLKPLEFATLKSALQRAHDSARTRRAKWQEVRALDMMYANTRTEIASLQSLISQLQSRLAQPENAR